MFMSQQKKVLFPSKKIKLNYKQLNKLPRVLFLATTLKFHYTDISIVIMKFLKSSTSLKSVAALVFVRKIQNYFSLIFH